MAATPKKKKATKRKKTATARISDATPALPEAPPAPAAAPELFETHHLLDLCRTKWQYGAWADLMALSEDEIALDADRAKVMLLVAVAHSHAGDAQDARRCARQALAWGCDRRLVARLLISAGVNSLARVATALEDPAADSMFAEALGLVEGRADVRLLARTRQLRETGGMGLLPAAAALIDADLALARRAPEAAPRLADLQGEMAILREALKKGAGAPAIAPGQPAADVPVPPRRLVLAAPALQRYAVEGLEERFLYIDSKSLPRAGLHFLRDRLDEILGPAFSFCEQYHEPGCCGRAPCVSLPALREDRLSVRLIKSHDFTLGDPVFDLAPAMRRLVLLRDPLFVLTSWWALHTLSLHEARLTEAGMSPHRLFFRHEKPLLSQAYDLVAEAGPIAPAGKLEGFLANAAGYLVRFMAKWADPAREAPGTVIIPYEGVQPLLIDWLRPFRDRMEPAAVTRLDALAADPRRFHPRNDPFKGPNDAYSRHLAAHADLFRTAVQGVVKEDRTGWARQLIKARG